jgi:Flp pilus assembly protein CpaB
MRRFSDVAAQGIRSQLKGTMRAVQIAGDANQLLSGTLQTGDHVDIVANLRLNNQSSAAATRIVLRDLTVLTTPSSASKLSGSSNGSDSVILAVSDTQVQRLFFVLKNADWTLELRPVVNAADSGERIDTLNTVLGEGR